MYTIIGGDGQPYGPVTAEQLRDWLREGRVNAQTLVMTEGDTEWRPLSQHPVYADLAGAPVQPPPLSTPVLPTRSPTNSMAVASLVTGCVSLICCQLFGVLGLVFGLVALSQIKANPTGGQGRGLAVAGIACSVVSLVILLVIMLFYLVMVLIGIGSAHTGSW